ncbi:MAG: ROK family protein [Phycisphaerales bacterium]|nr:ROK family protein [Phycisphaerales bacterium]
MPPAKPIIGIDLGGTNMQIGVVSPDRKLLATAKRKTKADEGQDAVIGRIVDGVEEACATAKIRVADLGAVGIGAPGAVDPNEGVVLEAVNLRWTDTPLAEIMTRKLGVRTFLDNDVNVAVFGEHRMGAGRGAAHLFGVWIGTGIGGGLIFDNKLFYGHFLTAGEFGHTILFPNNPPGHRSVEHNCSRSAVVDQVVRLIKANRKSMLTDMFEGDFDKVKSKQLAKAYEAGDELTREVIDHTAEVLGVAIGSVVTLLSIQRVVLGGGLTEAIGAPWVKLIRESVARIVFPDRCKNVEIVASELEDNAGVFGAALIAGERAG